VISLFKETKQCLWLVPNQGWWVRWLGGERGDTVRLLWDEEATSKEEEGGDSSAEGDSDCKVGHESADEENKRVGHGQTSGSTQRQK